MVQVPASGSRPVKERWQPIVYDQGPIAQDPKASDDTNRGDYSAVSSDELDQALEQELCEYGFGCLKGQRLVRIAFRKYELNGKQVFFTLREGRVHVARGIGFVRLSEWLASINEGNESLKFQRSAGSDMKTRAPVTMPPTRQQVAPPMPIDHNRQPLMMRMARLLETSPGSPTSKDSKWVEQSFKDLGTAVLFLDSKLQDRISVETRLLEEVQILSHMNVKLQNLFKRAQLSLETAALQQLEGRIETFRHPQVRADIVQPIYPQEPIMQNQFTSQNQFVSDSPSDRQLSTGLSTTEHPSHADDVTATSQALKSLLLDVQNATRELQVAANFASKVKPSLENSRGRDLYFSEAQAKSDADPDTGRDLIYSEAKANSDADTESPRSNSDGEDAATEVQGPSGRGSRSSHQVASHVSNGDVESDQKPDSDFEIKISFDAPDTRSSRLAIFPTELPAVSLSGTVSNDESSRRVF